MSISGVLVELIASEEYKCYKETKHWVHDEDGSRRETIREYKTLQASKVWKRYLHDGGEFRKGQQFSREQQIQIPAEAMHSLKEEHAALRWYVRITVELRRRLGSVTAFYNLAVLPRQYSSEGFVEMHTTSGR